MIFPASVEIVSVISDDADTDFERTSEILFFGTVQLRPPSDNSYPDTRSSESCQPISELPVTFSAFDVETVEASSKLSDKIIFVSATVAVRAAVSISICRLYV